MAQIRKIQEILGLMEKNLQCSICLELLLNPVATKCDHQFCRKCIEEAIGHKSSTPCPLCMKPITKRSLDSRPHFNQIVTSVREVICAFQLDTGTVYSPPKGPPIPLTQLSSASPQSTSPLPPGPKGRKRLSDEDCYQQSKRSNVRRPAGKRRRVTGKSAIFVDGDAEQEPTPPVTTNINISNGFPVPHVTNKKNKKQTGKRKTRAHDTEEENPTDEGVDTAALLRFLDSEPFGDTDNETVSENKGNDMRNEDVVLFLKNATKEDLGGLNTPEINDAYLANKHHNNEKVENGRDLKGNSPPRRRTRSRSKGINSQGQSAVSRENSRSQEEAKVNESVNENEKSESHVEMDKKEGTQQESCDSTSTLKPDKKVERWLQGQADLGECLDSNEGMPDLELQASQVSQRSLADSVSPPHLEKINHEMENKLEKENLGNTVASSEMSSIVTKNAQPMEKIPIGRKIFKSKLQQNVLETESGKDNLNDSTDDPYHFKVSQHTPKPKKSKGKRSRSRGSQRSNSIGQGRSKLQRLNELKNKSLGNAKKTGSEHLSVSEKQVDPENLHVDVLQAGPSKAKRIFKTRLLQMNTTVEPDLNASSDDPYHFKVSQHTPKAKKSSRGRKSRSKQGQGSRRSSCSKSKEGKKKPLSMVEGNVENAPNPVSAEPLLPARQSRRSSRIKKAETRQVSEIEIAEEPTADQSVVLDEPAIVLPPIPEGQICAQDPVTVGEAAIEHQNVTTEECAKTVQQESLDASTTAGGQMIEGQGHALNKGQGHTLGEGQTSHPVSSKEGLSSSSIKPTEGSVSEHVATITSCKEGTKLDATVDLTKEISDESATKVCLKENNIDGALCRKGDVNVDLISKEGSTNDDPPKSPAGKSVVPNRKSGSPFDDDDNSSVLKKSMRSYRRKKTSAEKPVILPTSTIPIPSTNGVEPVLFEDLYDDTQQPAKKKSRSKERRKPALDKMNITNDLEEGSPNTEAEMNSLIEKISNAETFELMIGSQSVMREAEQDQNEAVMSQCVEVSERGIQNKPTCPAEKNVKLPSQMTTVDETQDLSDDLQEVAQGQGSAGGRSDGKWTLQRLGKEAAGSNTKEQVAATDLNKRPPADKRDDWSHPKQMKKDFVLKGKKLKMKKTRRKKRSQRPRPNTVASDSDEEEVTIVDTTPKIVVRKFSGGQENETGGIIPPVRPRSPDSGSDTDPLDIELSQVAYEKPNLDIQPEEIKQRLSQQIDLEMEELQPSGKAANVSGATYKQAQELHSTLGETMRDEKVVVVDDSATYQPGSELNVTSCSAPKSQNYEPLKKPEVTVRADTTLQQSCPKDISGVIVSLHNTQPHGTADAGAIQQKLTQSFSDVNEIPATAIRETSANGQEGHTRDKGNDIDSVAAKGQDSELQEIKANCVQDNDLPAETDSKVCEKRTLQSLSPNLEDVQSSASCPSLVPPSQKTSKCFKKVREEVREDDTDVILARNEIHNQSEGQVEGQAVEGDSSDLDLDTGIRNEAEEIQDNDVASSQSERCGEGQSADIEIIPHEIDDREEKVQSSYEDRITEEGSQDMDNFDIPVIKKSNRKTFSLDTTPSKAKAASKKDCFSLDFEMTLPTEFETIQDPEENLLVPSGGNDYHQSRVSDENNKLDEQKDVPSNDSVGKVDSKRTLSHRRRTRSSQLSQNVPTAVSQNVPTISPGNASLEHREERPLLASSEQANFDNATQHGTEESAMLELSENSKNKGKIEYKRTLKRHLRRRSSQTSQNFGPSSTKNSLKEGSSEHVVLDSATQHETDEGPTVDLSEGTKSSGSAIILGTPVVDGKRKSVTKMVQFTLPVEDTRVESGDPGEVESLPVTQNSENSISLLHYPPQNENSVQEEKKNIGPAVSHNSPTSDDDVDLLSQVDLRTKNVDLPSHETNRRSGNHTGSKDCDNDDDDDENHRSTKFDQNKNNSDFDEKIHSHPTLEEAEERDEREINEETTKMAEEDAAETVEPELDEIIKDAKNEDEIIIDEDRSSSPEDIFMATQPQQQYLDEEDNENENDEEFGFVEAANHSDDGSTLNEEEEIPRSDKAQESKEDFSLAQMYQSSDSSEGETSDIGNASPTEGRKESVLSLGTSPSRGDREPVPSLGASQSRRDKEPVLSIGVSPSCQSSEKSASESKRRTSGGKRKSPKSRRRIQVISSSESDSSSDDESTAPKSSVRGVRGIMGRLDSKQLRMIQGAVHLNRNKNVKEDKINQIVHISSNALIDDCESDGDVIDLDKDSSEGHNDVDDNRCSDTLRNVTTKQAPVKNMDSQRKKDSFDRQDFDKDIFTTGSTSEEDEKEEDTAVVPPTPPCQTKTSPSTRKSPHQETPIHTINRDHCESGNPEANYEPDEVDQMTPSKKETKSVSVEDPGNMEEKGLTSSQEMMRVLANVKKDADLGRMISPLKDDLFDKGTPTKTKASAHINVKDEHFDKGTPTKTKANTHNNVEEEEERDEEDKLEEDKEGEMLADNGGGVSSQEHVVDMTSSSALSSQSELICTQLKENLEEEVERTRAELAKLEEQLLAQQNDDETLEPVDMDDPEAMAEDELEDPPENITKIEQPETNQQKTLMKDNENPEEEEDDIEEESEEEEDEPFDQSPPVPSPSPPPSLSQGETRRSRTLNLPDDVQKATAFLEMYKSRSESPSRSPASSPCKIEETPPKERRFKRIRQPMAEQRAPVSGSTTPGLSSLATKENASQSSHRNSKSSTPKILMEKQLMASPHVLSSPSSGSKVTPRSGKFVTPKVTPICVEKTSPSSSEFMTPKVTRKCVEKGNVASPLSAEFFTPKVTPICVEKMEVPSPSFSEFMTPKVTRICVEKREVASPLSAGFMTPKQKGIVLGSPVMRSPELEHWPRREHWSLVVTGMGRQDMMIIQSFLEKVGCRLASKFNRSTSHVITKTVEDDHRVCERTLKYFMGIAGRCWVLSIDWIRDCIRKGCLVPEEDYEIKGDTVNGLNHHGPRRARMSRDPLLQDYELCVYGAFPGLSKDDLRSMVELCGASSVSQPSLFSYSPTRKHLIVALDDGEENDKYEKMYKRHKIPVVSREWVLDSVAKFRVQPLPEYLLCEVKPKDLEQY